MRHEYFWMCYELKHKGYFSNQSVVHGVSSQLHAARLADYNDAAPSLQRTNFKTIPTYFWLPNEICIGSEAFVTVKSCKLCSSGAWRRVGSQTVVTFSMYVPTDLQSWRLTVQNDIHVLTKRRCYPTNPRFAIPRTMSGVINLFCAMVPCDSLMKPIDPFSENILMNKMEIVRFIEVNKHFWTLEATNWGARWRSG